MSIFNPNMDLQLAKSYWNLEAPVVYPPVEGPFDYYIYNYYPASSTYDIRPWITQLSDAAVDNNDYWAISSINNPEAYIQTAYSLMDSLAGPEQLEEALMMFNQLAQDAYLPSIAGFEEAMVRLGSDSYSINFALDQIAFNPDVDTTQFCNALRLRKGAIHRHQCNFDDAILYFSNLSTQTTGIDSIQSLMEMHETIRLQAMLEEASGPQTASLGNSASHRIAKAERSISELNDAKIEYYRKNSSTEEILPTEFKLGNAYPNPFNPSVSIPFALPQNANVCVSIYNVLGQKVKSLVNRNLHAGDHRVMWDGKSDSDILVSSGIYFIQMKVDSFVQTKKIIMMK